MSSVGDTMESSPSLRDLPIKRCQQFKMLKGFLVLLVIAMVFFIFWFTNLQIFPVTKLANETSRRPWAVTRVITTAVYPTVYETQQKTAIIVPMRGRELHLKLFTRYMLVFLEKQKIDYRIYVIEQSEDGKEFNKGTLLNVGFVEALKVANYSCFIFHDIDLIPESDDNPPYKCGRQPIHLSAAVDTLNYTDSPPFLSRLPYDGLIGGAFAIRAKQLKSVNGYSNSYWGWGGEDDDLARRLYFNGFRFWRYPRKISRYSMLPHIPGVSKRSRFKILEKWQSRYRSDGINSLNYTIEKYERRDDYTRILVNIN
ncbi:beta-1:4-N-acetylgalactosaminyl transferase (BRE-4)-like protein [Leptotrombidium deliense]|uniref:Beta-1,4-N-acetylgalactosaminyltransferase n=1 Tax=Leptotrombidium deliense TaxID=299467 RepID=A0A443SD61_9ACAR|nr:beta-1:4-N-acetylgalactosaminyl transferase (BRE-4)-like protein [Leptotrombidium deliense]